MNALDPIRGRAARYSGLADRMDADGNLPGLNSSATATAISLSASFTAADVPTLLAVVDAVLALHSPEPGWEREWKDPEWALANGEVRCAGCQTHVTFTPLKACRTRKAIEDALREAMS